MPRIKRSRLLDLEKKYPATKFLPNDIFNYYQTHYQLLQLTVQLLINSLCLKLKDGSIRLKNPVRNGSFLIPDINLFIWGIAYEFFNYLKKRKIEKTPLEAILRSFVRSYNGIMKSEDSLIRNKIVSKEEFLKAVHPLSKLTKRVAQNIGANIPKLETGELETIIYSYFKSFVPSRFTETLIYEAMVIIWNTLRLEEESVINPENIRKRIKKSNIITIDPKELQKTLSALEKKAQEEKQAIHKHISRK